MQLKTFGITFKNDYRLVATISIKRAAELLNTTVYQLQKFGGHGSLAQRQIALARPEMVICFQRDGTFTSIKKETKDEPTDTNGIPG